MLDFKQKIQATETFGKFEEFKKRITLHKSNIERLKDLHHQAEKFGIGYLEQNSNLTKSDVGIVRDVLNMPIDYKAMEKKVMNCEFKK